LFSRAELPNSLTDFLYFEVVLKVGQKIWHSQNNLYVNELWLLVWKATSLIFILFHEKGLLFLPDVQSQLNLSSANECKTIFPQPWAKCFQFKENWFKVLQRKRMCPYLKYISKWTEIT
jgi:hypothetical protein